MSSCVQEALFGPSISTSRPRSQLRRAAVFFHRHRAKLCAIVVLTLVTSAANALEPLVLKYVFDGLNSRRPFTFIAAGIAFLASMGAMRELVFGYSTLLTWKTRLSVHQQLLETLVNRLHRLPV